MRLSRRMNDDLSDGLAAELSQNPCICCKGCFCQGWAECRRRAEAHIEELNRWIKVKDKALFVLKSLYDEEIEKARREAFEAGWPEVTPNGTESNEKRAKISQAAYLSWRWGNGTATCMTNQKKRTLPNTLS